MGELHDAEAEFRRRSIEARKRAKDNGSGTLPRIRPNAPNGLAQTRMRTGIGAFAPLPNGHRTEAERNRRIWPTRRTFWSATTG
jgi:hypothetical protein